VTGKSVPRDIFDTVFQHFSRRGPFAQHEAGCRNNGVPRWKQRPEFGPVLLVYADGLVRHHGTDPVCYSLLHCELHPSNEVPMRQVFGLREGPELLDPLLIFIWTKMVGSSGEELSF